jgi:hypothetical protein
MIEVVFTNIYIIIMSIAFVLLCIGLWLAK